MRLVRGAAFSLATAATIAPLFAADGASARTETVRWTYSDASRVTGFRVRIGSSSGSYSSVINVGKPTPAGGVYSATITAADAATVYAVIAGYDATQESPNSNERVLLPPPPPTEPPPTEPPTTSSPPLTGALIDATLAAGDDPAGWIDTRPYNQMSTDSKLFKVMSLSGNLVYGTTSTSLNIHSHFATRESAEWTSYEVRGRMRISHPDGGIGVTALSQYPREDAYYRVRRNKGSTTAAFHISPHPGDRAIACSSAKSAVTPLPNLWYRFRFQVVPQSANTVVRAKVWSDGAGEPSTWQMDCADTSPDRLVRGVPGVWSMGPGVKYWDDLQVVPVDDAPTASQPLGAPDAPVLLGP